MQNQSENVLIKQNYFYTGYSYIVQVIPYMGIELRMRKYSSFTQDGVKMGKNHTISSVLYILCISIFSNLEELFKRKQV